MEKKFEIGKVYFYNGNKTLYSQINSEYKKAEQYKYFNFMFLSEKIVNYKFNDSFYKILILQHRKIGWIYCRSDEALWSYVELCQ